MSRDKISFDTLDLSERLRFLMVSYKLSVAEMAEAAGVSKSAMEKYLAGPSSPRATSVAALCVNLGVNAEWVLFGRADDDLRRTRDLAFSAFLGLIEDIARMQTLDDPMIDLSDKSQRSSALSVASDHAEDLVRAITADRIRIREQRIAGLREVEVGPFPLFNSASQDDAL